MALHPVSSDDVHHVTKKVSQLMFDNNFGKCGSIFTNLSPGGS